MSKSLNRYLKVTAVACLLLYLGYKCWLKVTKGKNSEDEDVNDELDDVKENDVVEEIKKEKFPVVKTIEQGSYIVYFHDKNK